MSRLKAPDLKPPAFLGDLYYDLRERRLLPLVGLVVVAIAAVPFLLGGAEETVELPAGAGVAAELDAARERTSSLTVVEAKPGLRDYRKRLRDRKPTDPFEQRYTSPALEGAGLNGAEGSGSSQSDAGSKSTTDGSSADSGSAADGGSSPPPNPGGAPPSKGGPKKPQLTFFSWAINVRIVKSAGGKKGDPIVRKRVLSQTPLPGKKAPVVTYMGAARKGKKITGKALLLVSDDVRSVAGDARCLSGGEVCQLLEVEPGFPVVLTYGENEVKYTVNVQKLGLVVTGHS